MSKRLNRPAFLTDALTESDECCVPGVTPTRTGYMRIWVGHRCIYAHRWVWEQANGPIPSGLEIDHLCNNRSCCRLSHLQLLTHAENVRQITLRGRHEMANRTHCRRAGHPLSGDNLGIDKRNGARFCRECSRAADRRHYWRVKVAAGATAAVGALVMFPGVAYLHHTTTTCVAPGQWSIENSEGISMTYTTDQGHSGSIGPNGTDYVTYSGTSLTVYGTWANGFTNTNTGTGDCTVTTTSTTSSTSTTIPGSTTSSTTTTQPAATSSQPTSSTTIPSTTTAPSSVPPTTGASSTSTTAPATTSSSPPSASTTSEPPSSSTTTPSSSTPPVGSSTTPAPTTAPLTPPVTGQRPTTTQPSGNCSPTASDGSAPSPTQLTCGTPLLPATGASDLVWLLPAALLIVASGAVTLIYGRRR